jgi:hypothetical protein
LATRLKLLFGYPPNLTRLAEAARALGTAEAASNLAILVAGMCPARSLLARDQQNGTHKNGGTAVLA